MVTPVDEPLRPGPRPSAERREAMIASATRLIAAQGVAGTSTRDVAALAGTTERTLFKHFGSKEGLVQAVVGSIISSFGAEAYARILAPEPLAHAEFADWICGFFLNRARYAATQPASYQVLFRELIGDAGFRARYGSAWVPGVFQPMVRQLQAMQDAGEIGNAHRASDLASAFFGLNLSYLLARSVLAPGHDWADERDAATIAAMFMAICGAGTRT